MAAATHMVGSAHSAAPSSPISPRPPWHPVVNHQRQALYDDYDRDVLVTPSSSPSTFPTTPATTASPAREDEHLRRRPASRRAGKQRRRPRPSRKLPTTYISADAASFRRMVHQVTGAAADDVLLHHQATAELLCRPAAPPSSRAAQMTMTAATLLPTLDTSAFLIGSGRTPPLAPRPGSSACCHAGSAVAVRDPGAVLKPEVAEEACGGGGGFPSLESWDDADAIFQDQE